MPMKVDLQIRILQKKDSDTIFVLERCYYDVFVLQHSLIVRINLFSNSDYICY